MKDNDNDQIIYVKDENGDYVPEQDSYQRPKRSRVSTSLERRRRINFWVRFGILALIEAVACFFMADIAVSPIPLVFAVIPAVITGILYGPALGSSIGAVGGVATMLAWSIVRADSPVAFIYSPFVKGGGIASLLVAVIPLALAGLVAALLYTGISTMYELRIAAKNAKKLWWHMPLIYVICAATASLTYTLLNVTGIYLCFSHSFALALEINEGLVLVVLGGLILSKGLIESLIAAASTTLVCVPFKYLKNKFQRKADN